MNEAKLNGQTDYKSREQIFEEEKQKRISKDLEGYIVEDNVGDIKTVADLWGDNSIFYYDAKRAQE